MRCLILKESQRHTLTLSPNSRRALSKLGGYSITRRRFCTSNTNHCRCACAAGVGAAVLVKLLVGVHLGGGFRVVEVLAAVARHGVDAHDSTTDSTGELAPGGFLVG